MAWVDVCFVGAFSRRLPGDKHLWAQGSAAGAQTKPSRRSWGVGQRLYVMLVVIGWVRFRSATSRGPPPYLEAMFVLGFAPGRGRNALLV